MGYISGLSAEQQPIYHARGQSRMHTTLNLGMAPPDSVSIQQPQTEAQGDGKFSLWTAAKNLGKGIISPLTVFIKHPVIAFGGLAAGGAACSLAPALVPAMAIGFGIYSAYQVAKGAINVAHRYSSGDYDGAEHAFEDIGAGGVSLALGFLGLRGTAAASLEAKASHAAAQAGKSAEQIMATGSEALGQAFKLSTLEALKETANILTTTEGRAALLGQFRPASMSRRIGLIRKYFATPASERNKVTTSIKDSEFTRTPEGVRRSQLSKADVQKDAETVLAQSCDDLGIPAELRPKFNVTDELRHLDASEIEALAQAKVKSARYSASSDYNCGKKDLPQVKIFEDGEVPAQFTNEQIVEKTKVALNKAYDEMGVPERSINRSYLENKPGDFRGQYQSRDHQVSYDGSTYRQGITIEQIVAHEAKHAEQALLRMQLSDAEQAAILQEQLLNGVRHGETEEILHQWGFLGNIMMKPPKLTSQGMRNQLATLMEQKVYPQVKQLSNWDEKTGAVQKLEQRLTALIDEHPAFVKSYGDGGKDAALKHLMDYMEAHCNRYKVFSTPEITNPQLVEKIRKLPFPGVRRQEAIQSMKDTIATLEGNSRTQGLKIFGVSQAEFDQYQFSPEEALARLYAATFEKQKVQAALIELKQAAQDNPAKEQMLLQRLTELDFETERVTAGKTMYDAFTRHINDPDNPVLLEEFNRLKQQYEPLREKHLQLELKRSRHRVTEIVSTPFPLRNGVQLRGGDDSHKKSA